MKMSEESVTTYTILQLRFKLRLPPDVLLSNSREAASIIAATKGLIWKIWVSKKDEFEMGGIYLFASRETAQAYLNHPAMQAVRSNDAVVSSEAKLWDVENSLSAITRAPLPGVSVLNSEPEIAFAGGY
jgi:hypothetical protein